jgi:hypothetical protein
VDIVTVACKQGIESKGGALLAVRSAAVLELASLREVN